MTRCETAYAKINLALHVRRQRDDGYHEIETVFAFCADGDEVTARPSDATVLTITGRFAGGLSVTDNLVIRAAEACGVTSRLHLDKLLPVASGVGGGSADAAAVLRLFGSKVSDLSRIARSLGADVPACLTSTTMRGGGVGEELTPIESVAGTPVLLVNPMLPLSTAAVFAAWDGSDRGSLGDWREGRNDLTMPAITLVPQIADVLDWLAGQAGQNFVRMSGSGATCFALFDNDAARDGAAARVPEHWWHLASVLR